MKTLFQVFKFSLLKSLVPILSIAFVGAFFYYVLGVTNVFIERGLVLVILFSVYIGFVSRELMDWYWQKKNE